MVVVVVVSYDIGEKKHRTHTEELTNNKRKRNDTIVVIFKQAR